MFDGTWRKRNTYSFRMLLFTVHAFMLGKIFQKAVMGNVFSLLWALPKGESFYLYIVQFLCSNARNFYKVWTGL